MLVRKGLTSCLHRCLSSASECLSVSAAVENAVQRNEPVVALETAILTHGLPYPHNVHLCCELQEYLRAHDVTPATTGVIDGRLHVGMTNDQVQHLGKVGKNAKKLSIRDLYTIYGRDGECGGTTVAATMHLCSLAGVRIFATGGIGGVHRGVKDSWDISADLVALAAHRVTVVCAGAKSFLDVGKTLEVLETNAVPVMSYRNAGDFPGFYCRQSGHKAPIGCESLEQVVSVMCAQDSLRSQAGLLLAIAPPDEVALPTETVEQWVRQAESEAKEKVIGGQDTTPFVLGRINEISEEVTLRTNLSLVKNNVSHAAKLAKLYHNQRRALHTTTTARRQTNGKVVVAGMSAVDIYTAINTAKQCVSVPLGSTTNGSVWLSAGGVGRNLAAALTRLGTTTTLLTCIGGDALGGVIRRSLAGADVHCPKGCDEARTVTFSSVLNAQREVLFFVGDADQNEMYKQHFNEQFFAEHVQKRCREAGAIAFDAHVPVTAQAHLKSIDNVPTLFEPTDSAFAHRAFTNHLDADFKPLTFATPNLDELRVIYNHIVEEPEPSHTARLADRIRTACRMCQAVSPYVHNLLVTLGSDGVLLYQRVDSANAAYLRQPLLCFDEWGAQALHYQVRNSPPVVNSSGAGDCLAAAFLHQIVRGVDIDIAIKAGMKAAHISLAHDSAVPDQIYYESFEIDDIIDWSTNHVRVKVLDASGQHVERTGFGTSG